jgi:hypothetical protein
MSDTPWTPGPWREYHTDNAGGPYSEVRVGTHPTEGGTLKRNGGDYFAICGMRSAMTYDELLANTALIALAPDMAAAILEFDDEICALGSTEAGTGQFFEAQRRVQDLANRLRAIKGDNNE